MGFWKKLKLTTLTSQVSSYSIHLKLMGSTQGTVRPCSLFMKSKALAQPEFVCMAQVADASTSCAGPLGRALGHSLARYIPNVRKAIVGQ